MWAQYRLASQQFRRCASGLRACLRAWRCRVSFQRMHRIVARNSRPLRRRRFDDLLRQAEATDYSNRVDQLFFLLRRHAPKQPRTRAQLRSSTGALLMPKAEAKELAKYWKEVIRSRTRFQATLHSICARLLFSTRSARQSRASFDSSWTPILLHTWSLNISMAFSRLCRCSRPWAKCSCIADPFESPAKPRDAHCTRRRRDTNPWAVPGACN